MILDILSEHLQSNCALVGVGNVLYGDDGFGPQIIKQLKNETCVPLLDGGIAPENLTGPLNTLRPEVVIIFDAVALEAPAGSLHWLTPQDLETTGISTHGPSLDILMDYLRQNLDVKIFIVGIVPAQIALGQNLSKTVRTVTQRLVDFISKLRPTSKKEVQ